MIPKKNIIAFILLALVIVGAVSAVEFESDTQDVVKLHFSFERPLIEHTVILNQSYHTVTMGNLPAVAEVGNPCLPMHPVNVLLPFASQIEDITVTASGKTSLGGGYAIVPMGSSLPLSTQAPSTSLHQNPMVYHAPYPFPRRIYTEVSVSYFRGYAIATLGLYPVQYTPSNGELWYYKDITVTINTEEGDSNTLFRALPQDGASVKELVSNPSVAASYTDSTDGGSASASFTANYSYVIITNETFEAAFRPLLKHKSLFITARMVNLTYIQSNFTGADTQEKIRNFIRHAYFNWSTEYVLLGGDDHIIPYRGMYGSVPSVPVTEDYGIPTDLYYAALDGTWNSDGDDRWGESHEADWFAEVYVGRAPVSTSAEVTIFVNKVLAFETSEKPTRVQLHQSRLESDNDPDSRVTPEACAAYIPGTYTVQKLYEENEFITRAKWIDAFSEGCFVIQHEGHGSAYEYYLNFEKDGVTIWYSSNVYSLDNDFYPIYLAPICYAGAFDKSDCIGETLLLYEDGGASACILNSRYGWYSTNNAHVYSGFFAERQFRELFHDDNITVGGMMQVAKEYFYPYAAVDPTYRWCYYEINLLGDPETPAFAFRGHTEPMLSYAPFSHDFGTLYEGDTSTTHLEIWNAGVGTLTYTVNESCSWVSVHPMNGSSSGEHDILTIDVNTTGLSHGHHVCTVSIHTGNESGVVTLEVDVLTPPNEVWVDDDYTALTEGWMYDHFDTIQGGVDAVSEGGVVYVHSGLYIEQVVISKTLQVVGQDTHATRIIGSGADALVNITADHVHLSHLTIEGSGAGSSHGGLTLFQAPNSTVAHCRITHHTHGMEVRASEYSTLRNVTLDNNTYSVGVYGEDVIHFHHDIDTSNTVDGAPIYYLVGEHGLVFDATPMGFLGIVSCSNITVTHSTLANNSQGVVLVDASHATIAHCTVYNTYVGISLLYSHKTHVHYTAFYNNSEYGMYNALADPVYSSDARYNYWGALQGPSHLSNPGGTGDRVSTNVEVTPWLSAPIRGGGNQSVGGGDTTVDMRWETDTVLYITATQRTDVTIVSYADVPGEAPQTATSIGTYIDVFVDNESVVTWPLNVTIYYTQQDLDRAGISEHNLVGISFFNDSSAMWELYKDTGVHMGNSSVNGRYYEGYVWAHVPHLTKLTIIGDITPPHTTYSLNPSSPDGEGGWYKGNVTVTLTASDNISAVSEIRYRIDEGIWTVYTGPFTIDDGSHVIEYYALDTSGNQEDSLGFSVKIDKILPDTTHSLSPLEPTGDNDWYTTNVHVVLHAYDGLSGVDVTTYRLNGGDWQTYAGEFIVGQEGHIDIEYYSIDNASNAEAPQSFSLKIDKTPPTTEYVRTPSAPDGESGWYTTNVTLILTPSDAHSGVHTTSYKVDNETWKTYASPRVLTDEGAQAFTFYSVDNAGNMEPHHTRTIKIDRTPPVASILHPAEGTLYLFGRAILPALGGRILILGGITVEVNATDVSSGIAWVELFVDDTLLDNDTTSPYTWDLTRLVGRHVLMVKAYDAAGHVTTRELTVTIFSFF